MNADGKHVAESAANRIISELVSFIPKELRELIGLYAGVLLVAVVLPSLVFSESNT
jgi:hypothetical protein